VTASEKADGRLVSPESVKSLGRQLGIPNRMRDVLVPQVVLDGSCVVPVVRQLVSAGVSQHVGVDREGDLGKPPRPCHDLANAGGRQRPFTLP